MGGSGKWSKRWAPKDGKWWSSFLRRPDSLGRLRLDLPHLYEAGVVGVVPSRIYEVGEIGMVDEVGS